MSATLNAAAFSKYYNDCPSLNIPGFTYPVEEVYLEDIFTLNRFTKINIEFLCLLYNVNNFLTIISCIENRFRYFPKKQMQRSRKIKPGDPFGEFVIPYVK